MAFVSVTDCSAMIIVMENLCMCGCGITTLPAKTTDARFGHIKGDPLPWVKGHNAKRRGFVVEYEVDPFTGCWNWLGDISRLSRAEGSVKTGYPRYGNAWRLKNPGRTPLAHRVYYENHIGEIPPGNHVDHLCFNRKCVNPEHLEAVTPAENNRRKWVKYQERKLTGEKTAWPHGKRHPSRSK